MSKDDATMHILRKVVIDGFLLCGLVVSIFVTSIYWQPFERGFFCGDESLMFPYKGDTVTVLMLRLFGLGIPFLSILICEWTLLHDYEDDQRCLRVRIPAWVRSCYCVIVSFSLGVCFTELTANVAKSTIGRLRPHFFDVCQPSVNCRSPANLQRYIRFSEYTCTGDRDYLFRDMRKSFLSGHSSWAAFTMIYAALYLEKRMVWRGTRTIRHVLQFSCVMLSWYCALSRISDNKHHWSDVLAGYLVGTIMAVITFAWGTELIEKKDEHHAVPQNDITLGSHHITAESA